jgi:rRNA maturation protein Nop10
MVVDVTFRGDEVDTYECGNTSEYEFQETCRGCGIEIFVED